MWHLLLAGSSVIFPIYMTAFQECVQAATNSERKCFFFSSCIVCPYKFHKIIRFLNDRKCLIVHWRWLWINSCVRTLDHRWWWWYEWNKERGVENKSTAWNVMKLHCIVSPLYTQKYNTCLWVNNGYRK